jgi:type IV pilus assembly protein PilC
LASLLWMNYDELSFFNQQLAGMLREGIPLEGAIRQLSAGMRDKRLQAEFSDLEADLSRGAPLAEALKARRLPPLFIRLLQIGIASNDLPGVLTLLADHYQRANAIWTRLKGLMVYPFLVVLVSLSLTLLLALVFNHFMSGFFDQFHPSISAPVAILWMPPLTLGLLLVLLIAALAVPGVRAKLRWRLPGFREASLAQLASALAMMVRQGVPLPDALALAEMLESDGPAAQGLARWRGLIASGKGKPSDWTMPGETLPALFLWTVQQSGSNLAAGLQKTAELYYTRASYRIELLLYGALPVSILLLGQMVFWQIAPMMRSLIWLMDLLGGFGGNGHD